MRIDETVDFGPYARAFAALLIATVLTRSAAAAEPAEALAGAAFWGVFFYACWHVRLPLRARRWPTITPQWGGEAVAALGMLLFVATLLRDGILPALATLLCALTGAALVIAERRAHLLLIVATCLTQVLMVAAESRSALFVPCAAAFTLAVLTLFAFDIGATQRLLAAATPLQARKRGHGGALVALLTMLLALPLYLYVPQPPALYLGGRSATTAQDYSDPRGPPSRTPPGSRAPQRPDATSAGGAAPDATAATDEPGDGAGRQARDGSGEGQHAAAAHDDLPVTGVQRDAALANVIVMYVKTSQPVYLRGNLLDRFDGERWQRTGEAPQRESLRAGYLHLQAPDGGARIAQQIDIVADLHARTLFASAGATQIRFPGPTLYDNRDGTFSVPQPLRRDTSYSVDATPRLIGSRYAVDAAPPDARYLQLDASISGRVRELARAVTAEAGDAWHKALALEDHLRRNYAYSYETIVPYQGRTPLDWFLFENRKGHCEFFASAMVVMLREVGIPARLANGFSLGERNPFTGFYEVRAMDGHAWAEGWIEGRGWVMFEPTPFYPLPQQQEQTQQQVAGATDRYLERLADTSAQLAPRSLRTELLEIARDAWSHARHLQHVLVAWARRVLPWLPPVALLCWLVWGASTLARLAWRDTRERAAVRRLLAQAQAAPRRAPLNLASAVEIVFAARGAARGSARTWQEYCAALAAHGAALPASFADAFDACRYADLDAPAGAAESFDTVAALLRARLAAQPYPRLQQRLRAWRAALDAWWSHRHSAAAASGAR